MFTQLTLEYCPNWCLNSNVIASESVNKVVTKRRMKSNTASSVELSILSDEHDGATDSVSDLCHIFTSNESMLPSHKLRLSSPHSLVADEQLFATGIASKLFSFVVNAFLLVLLLLLWLGEELLLLFIVTEWWLMIVAFVAKLLSIDGWWLLWGAAASVDEDDSTRTIDGDDTGSFFLRWSTLMLLSAMYHYE